MSRQKLLTVRLHFWPKSLYESHYGLLPSNLAALVEKKFSILLDRAIAKELKAKTKSEEVVDSEIGTALGSFDNLERQAALKNDEDEAPTTSSGKSKRNDDDDDENLDASDVEDGDASAAKRASNRSEKVSYDDAEETDSNQSDEEVREEENENEGIEDTINADVDKAGDSRADRIRKSSRYVCDYRFDDKNGKWCELELKASDFCI
jgi:DNA-directed RNA polymerase I subunit RPA1